MRSFLVCLLLFTIGSQSAIVSVPATHPLLGGVYYPRFNETSPIDVTWFNYCNTTETPSKSCGSPGCFSIPYPVSLQMSYNDSAISSYGVYVSANILSINVMIAGQVEGNTTPDPTKILVTSAFQDELDDLSNVANLETLGGRAVGTISGLGDMSHIVGWAFSYITLDNAYQLVIETFSWTIYHLHSDSPTREVAASGNFFECTYNTPGQACIASSCIFLY